jgi:UDP-N-acetyl-D-mannosaminuronate dehydrogenase
VNHDEYKKIDLTRLDIRSKIILDTRNVATERQKKKFFEKKFHYISLGR